MNYLTWTILPVLGSILLTTNLLTRPSVRSVSTLFCWGSGKCQISLSQTKTQINLICLAKATHLTRIDAGVRLRAIQDEPSLKGEAS